MNKKELSSQKNYFLALALVLLVAFLLRLAFAYSMPFNSAPDEYTHYASVEFIAHHQALPLFGPKADLYLDPVNVWSYNVTYASLPGGGYLLPAGCTWLGIEMGAPEDTLYLFARVGNILTGILTLFLFALFARSCLDETISLAITALLALWPQYIFLNSYINSDSFTVLSTLVAFWAAYALWQKESKSYPLLAFNALAVGLVVLGKANAYPVALANGLIAIYHLYKFEKLKRLPLVIFAMASAFLLGGGWWLAHNIYHYGWSDLFGVHALQQAHLQARSGAEFNPSFQERGHSFFWFLTPAGLGWWKTLFRSFFARFDWMILRLPKIFYYIYTTFVGAWLALALYSFWQKRREVKVKNFLFQFLFLLPLAVFAAILALAIVNSWRVGYQPQGRYLLPALPLVLIGGANFFQKLSLKDHLKLILKGMTLLSLLFVTLCALLSTYLLFTEYKAHRQIWDYQTSPSRPLPALEKKIPTSQSFSQTFRLTRDNLRGIALYYRLYHAPDDVLSGRFILRTQEGKVLVEREISLLEKKHTYPLVITFEKLSVQKGDWLQFEIRPLPKGDPSQVHLFLTPPSYVKGELTLEGKKRGRDLFFHLLY